MDVFEYNTALCLEPLYSTSIQKCFNEFIKKDPDAYTIAREYLRSSDSELTLANLTYSEIDRLLDSFDFNELRRKYKEKRRVTKVNWYKTINEEISGKAGKRNKMLLSREIENRISLAALTENIVPNEETVRREIITKINKWKDDSTIPLIAYHYFPDKSIKFRVIAFMNDLILETLFLIETEFKGVANAVTNIPDDIIDNPVINFNSSKADFEARKLLEDEILYELDLKIPQGVFHSEISSPHSDYKEIVETQSFDTDEGIQVITTKKPLLDTKDSIIITEIFNRIRVKNTDTYITLSVKDLTKKVYNTMRPRQEQIDDVLERVNRINSWKAEVFVTRNNKLIRQASLRYIQGLDLDMSNGDPHYEVIPSTNMVNSYISRKYTGILSKTIDQLTSSKMRTVAMILQKLRIQTYHRDPDNMKTILTVADFRERMLFYKMKPFQIRKELHNIFLTIQKLGGLIENYELIEKEFHIQFTKIDTLEQNVLDINHNRNYIDNDGYNPNILIEEGSV